MVREQFIITHAADSYDVNRAREATCGGLIRIMQETGSKQMLDQRPSYNDIFDQGKALMVSRLDLVMHKPVMQDEEVQVTTYPCPSSRATFLRNYRIYSGDKVFAEISSSWVLVDKESRKILNVTDIDFSNYYYGEYKEAIDKKKFKITSDEEEMMEVVDTHIVRLSDTDCNGHMNNTYSLDMVCDYIPELLDPYKYRVHTVRLHFVNEAPIGDVLTIKRLKKEDGKYIFRVLKADGSVNINCQIELTELAE